MLRQASSDLLVLHHCHTVHSFPISDRSPQHVHGYLYMLVIRGYSSKCQEEIPPEMRRTIERVMPVNSETISQGVPRQASRIPSLR